MTDGFSNAGMVPVQFTAVYQPRFGVLPGRPPRA